VFAGGWTMEAAEVVCPGEGIDEDDVLDLLSKLVEKSLVVAETSSSPGAGGALRYRMLEPVRQYGRERLDEGGETERVRDRHARHYLKLAEAARPNLVGPEEAAWLARLEEEHDNLRAVLSWTIQGLEVEIGARLALALWRFWDWRGYLSEGRRWLESVLVLDGTDGRTEGAAPVLPALTRTTLLHVAGNLARAQGDYERAVALYEESLAIRREGGQKKGISASLHQLGIVEYERGEYEHAVRLHEQALALSREIEFTYGIAIVLSTLADVVRAGISNARERCSRRASPYSGAWATLGASRARSPASGRRRSATATATGLSRSTSTMPARPPRTMPTLRSSTK
jgi:tetratricopeptide (TPR) repeat protein